MVVKVKEVKQRNSKSCNNVDGMTIKDSWYLLLGMGP